MRIGHTVLVLTRHIANISFVRSHDGMIVVANEQFGEENCNREEFG
jgi:hypothetical protein